MQGYIIGNGVTFLAQQNYKVPFAHGMGLISDELYKVTYYVLYVSQFIIYTICMHACLKIEFILYVCKHAVTKEELQRRLYGY